MIFKNNNFFFQDLHCFSCNQNYPYCNYPFIDFDMLKGNYLPCAGQCVKFRNPEDNYSYYYFFIFELKFKIFYLN